MQKMIIYLLLIFCVSCTNKPVIEDDPDDVVYTYQSRYYAQALVDNKSRSYHWSNWEDRLVLVQINMDKQTLVVNTDDPLVYRIVKFSDKWTQDDGHGMTLSMRLVDQEENICSARLRIDQNGYSQIYVDYVDSAYCYSELTLLYDNAI